MSVSVDYIIVGQGLAGSALALECIKRGKRILVFDEPSVNRSSVIAAGICNPVTGKGMSKTFLADRLFPFLQSWYKESENFLGGSFFAPLPVYRPFLSSAERTQWLEKSTQEEIRMFVDRVWEGPYRESQLNNPYGGLELKLSGVLNVPRWIAAVRDLLRSQGVYREERINEEEVEAGDEIRYKDIRASRIIFCQGLSARKSRWFSWLPIRPLKGETVTVRMDFPEEKILSRGVYLVPSGSSGVFTVGSTYQHEPFINGPTEEGMKHIQDRLRALVRVPFEVLHQDWGIRPTVADRRPILGSHPAQPNVIIFNGLGTKGVSLSPYFASALTGWMDEGTALSEEVNISRFKSLYSNGSL